MIHPNWNDFIIGQRAALVVATATVAVTFVSRAGRFLRRLLSGEKNSFEDCLTMGLCLISFGGACYGLGAIAQNFVGGNTIVSLVPLLAGMVTLTGYYQVFVAWRGAYAGSIRPVVWLHALIIALVFAAATIAMASLHS